jgi:aflatoxin B1 aldehyde reductase
MTSQGIKIAFGAAPIGNNEPWKSTEDIDELFKILDKHNVTILDSAQLYGNSETRLGEVQAGSKFTIDTKWIGGWKSGSAAKDNIVTSAKESIAKLGVKKASHL